MKKKLLIILALATFGMALFAPKALKSYRTTYATEGEIWLQIQDYKMKNLKPYIYDQTTCSIARTRLDQIAQNFSHDDFYAQSKSIMTAHKITRLGENLLKYPPRAGMRFLTSPTSPLAGWLSSPSHKENLDNPMFTHSCLRCDQSYCVQIFAGY